MDSKMVDERLKGVYLFLKLEPSTPPRRDRVEWSTGGVVNWGSMWFRVVGSHGRHTTTHRMGSSHTSATSASHPVVYVKDVGCTAADLDRSTWLGGGGGACDDLVNF